MALVLFAWMSDQQYFKDLTNINTLQKLRARTDEDLENDVFTFFVDDGRIHDPEEIPSVIDLTETPNKEYSFF
jgi:hypothetical protein